MPAVKLGNAKTVKARSIENFTHNTKQLKEFLKHKNICSSDHYIKKLLNGGILRDGIDSVNISQGELRRRYLFDPDQVVETIFNLSEY